MRGQVALIFVLAFLTIAQCALMNYRLPARRSGSHVKHRHHLPGAQEIRKQFVEKTMEAEWYRRTSWFFNELLKKYKTKNDGSTDIAERRNQSRNQRNSSKSNFVVGSAISV